MRDRDPSSGARPARRAVTTGLLASGVLLAVLLVVMVNYLAARHYQRFDWTQSKRFSLSEKSLAILEAVDQDIDAIVFLTPSSAVQQQTFEQVDELLDRYAAAQPRIRKRVIDPARNLLEAERLVEDFAIDRADAVVITTADDRRVLESADFVAYDWSGASADQGPTIEAFRGEQLITSAILELIEAEKPRVVFTTGHGEATLESGELRSLSAATTLLGRDNFDLASWASLGQTAVPADADLVVIAGPTDRFLEEEVAVLDAYLTSGGRLLMLLDPAMAGTEFRDLGLRDLLARRGIATGDDLIVDPSQALAVGPETLFATEYGSHPIVDPLVGRPAILPLSRTVRRHTDVPTDIDVVVLVRASTEAWAETDLASLPDVQADADEAQGALPVAVASTWSADSSQASGTTDDDDESRDEPLEGRLVVIGDSDFATDGYLFDGANGDLLLGAFNWLIARESLLAITPTSAEPMKLTLSPSELRTVNLLALIVLPGLAIIAGIFVHLRRRR